MKSARARARFPFSLRKTPRCYVWVRASSMRSSRNAKRPSRPELGKVKRRFSDARPRPNGADEPSLSLSLSPFVFSPERKREREIPTTRTYSFDFARAGNPPLAGMCLRRFLDRSSTRSSVECSKPPSTQIWFPCKCSSRSRGHRCRPCRRNTESLANFVLCLEAKKTCGANARSLMYLAFWDEKRHNSRKQDKCGENTARASDQPHTHTRTDARVFAGVSPRSLACSLARKRRSGRGAAVESSRVESSRVESSRVEETLSSSCEIKNKRVVSLDFNPFLRRRRVEYKNSLSR